MQVIQGKFAEEKPKNLGEFLKKHEMLDMEIEGFIGFCETTDGRVVTMCHPEMSTPEILGALEIYKFGLNISMANGEV